MQLNTERKTDLMARYRNARELLQMMKEGDVRIRREISQRSFLLWCMYYFPELFEYQLAPFHYEMVEDLRFESASTVVWAMFRGSGKTIFAKLYCVYAVCEEIEDYILYDCHEVEVAKNHLLDIAVWLQTNEKIVADYGQLFYESIEEGDEKRSKLKSSRNFITKNDIMLRAMSTQKTPRGANFRGKRPSIWIVDDFENETTVESYKAIEKCIKHIDTARSGLAKNAKMIFLCNYFATNGVVEYLRTICKNDHTRSIFRKIDAETTNLLGDKVPSWQGRFTLTDKEKLIQDYQFPNRPKKTSLETERLRLNAGGRPVYEMEMLQQPQEAGTLYFDIDKMKIQEPFLRKPDYIAGDWKFWGKFDINKMYVMGADTSAGQGGDHATAVLIQLAYAYEPAKVIGVFSSNKVDSKELGKQMVSTGKIFGQCLLAPEINNTGYATVYEIRDSYPISRLYHRMERDKDKVKKTDKLGFYTTTQNKPNILLNLKYAVQNGELIIHDQDIYTEICNYPMKEVSDLSRTKMVTRHFDLVIATAIAFEARTQAQRSMRERRIDEKIQEDSFDPYAIF